MKEKGPDHFQIQLRLWACGLVLATACLGCSKLPFILQPPFAREEPSPAPPQESVSKTGETAYASSGRVPQELTSPSAQEEEKPKTVVAPEAKKPENSKSAMKPKALPALPPPSPPYYHSIHWSGETLSIIAAWYTGDGNNWKALAKANPHLNPNLISWGDEILIPQTLLKTREPMPKTFVEKFYQKSKKEASRPRAQPVRSEQDEPALFGPKRNF